MEDLMLDKVPSSTIEAPNEEKSTQPEGEITPIEEKEEIKPKSEVDLERETMKNSILINNPFMYIKEYRIYEIGSIEDYYIKEKKETILFGDIVRSVDLRRGKKIRKVKKIFEAWKSDYLITMNKNINDDIKRLGARPNIVLIGGASIAFLWLFTLIYAALAFVLFQNFIELPGFFIDLKIAIRSSLESVPFLIVSAVLGILILLEHFLMLKYNSVATSFKRMFDKNDKRLESSKTKILNDFEKKYKLAYKYYMKNIKKNSFFLPLNIEEIDCGAGLESFNNMVDKTNVIKDKYEKNHVILVLYKYPIYILLVLSILFVIGFVGYNYFINK